MISPTHQPIAIPYELRGQTKRKIVSSAVDQRRSLRLAVWLYFLLLIFEGALRKWALPQFSSALLLVRDPIAIWILFEAYRCRTFRFESNVLLALVLASMALITAMLFGHGDMFVGMFGARVFLIYIPLMFAIGWSLDLDDVERIGRWVLVISIPMTILVLAQFYSPQSAWVNRGVGGNLDGGGFSGAMGYMRPPGTFSFTNGLALFYGLNAAFIFYFIFFSDRRIGRVLITGATLALLAAIPFTISRSVLFSVVISLGFALVATAYRPGYFVRFLTGLLVIAALVLAILQTESAQIGLDVFVSRFNTANEVEGGTARILEDRILGGMLFPLVNSDRLPFWGYGIGLGTNAGAVITKGEMVFLISEGEWGRLIGELGLLLGLVAIGQRVWISFGTLGAAFLQLQKRNFLPWMIMSFALPNLLQGQFAQPTSLGFAIFAGGLAIASLRRRDNGAR